MTDLDAALAPHGGAPAAALDIGSNSIHLLVSRRGTAGVEILLDVSIQAGIGARVDHDGEIGEVGRSAVVEALDGYLADARSLGARPVLLLGTEPLRRARDGAILIEAIQARTGLALHVLSHEQEAHLALLGVTGGRPAIDLAVIDIGGGSSECILTVAGSAPQVAVLPTGSARLAAAAPSQDPVSTDDIDRLRAEAARHAARVPAARPATAVVTGGSGTNVSRLLGRPRTTPVDRAALEAAFSMLASRPAADLARDTGLSVRRVLQLTAGAALVEAVLDRLALDVAEVSDSSLRDGALFAAWAAGDAWADALPRLVTGPSTVEPRP